MAIVRNVVFALDGFRDVVLIMGVCYRGTFMFDLVRLV